MRTPVYDRPTRDEDFYARALAVLVGPSRRFKILMRIFNLLYWMAIIGALAWLFAQAIDRSAPASLHSATLLSPVVAAGDPVRVRYNFTRYRSCETDVSWAIYDGAQEVTRFGPIHTNATGRPAEESVVHAWATPLNAAPGQGRLRVIYAYECPGNYLHTVYPVVMILPDVLFTIVEPDPAITGEPRGGRSR
jgi:hypothetical protein